MSAADTTPTVKQSGSTAEPSDSGAQPPDESAPGPELLSPELLSAGGSDAVQLDQDAESDRAPNSDEGESDKTAQLDAAIAERDDYLDQLQRQRAEFQNYRKRVEAERSQQISAGVSRLVESLLPVLDGCDAAAAQGHSEVAAVGQSLMVALGKAGLERIPAVGEPFDPTQHEAVTIEAAPDGESAGTTNNADEMSPGDIALSSEEGSAGAGVQVVTAELRSGFRFDGRVLRAAMVKVRTG